MRYIYCHPLFDERKCAHRFSFQLKEVFRAAGLVLERFDYRGTGEADGEFADISLETLRQDIVAKIGGEQVCLIGVRFGASLAFDYCVHDTGKVRNLVLLQPVLGGARYVDYLYRKQHIKDLMTAPPSKQISDSGIRNIEGYKTNIKFINQLKAFDLLKMAGQYERGNSIFIGQITSRLKTEPEVINLIKLLAVSAAQVSVENIAVPMFWERIANSDYTGLTQKILRWCCA